MKYQNENCSYIYVFNALHLSIETVSSSVFCEVKRNKKCLSASGRYRKLIEPKRIIKKKQTCKPDSVPRRSGPLSFIQVRNYSRTPSFYPSTTDEKPLNADILEISPHRVYLVSLQPYLYILSVALVLISQRTGVTRYASLWCPDFPPFFRTAIRRSARQK